jgi:uncharacterized protein (DUF2164 family)
MVFSGSNLKMSREICYQGNDRFRKRSLKKKRMYCMKNEKTINLTKEKRDEMILAIKHYFSEERGEEIGDLRAGLMLDFIREELAPEFYNQGVSDSYKAMKDMAEDLLSIRR